jgi:hypothetical protein
MLAQMELPLLPQGFSQSPSGYGVTDLSGIRLRDSPPHRGRPNVTTIRKGGANLYSNHSRLKALNGDLDL